ncbi:hypothetical protein E2C01_021988 [Portunus trituberculatus]|uniref:Uncharacterized protein n=1 Tax=Portunus trituberculatus TaxID=210409 RepID=A0A5B7E618_PORTR|nr:hypothetical protein [Portunus trituberculatus]
MHIGHTEGPGTCKSCVVSKSPAGNRYMACVSKPPSPPSARLSFILEPRRLNQNSRRERIQSRVERAGSGWKSNHSGVMRRRLSRCTSPLSPRGVNNREQKVTGKSDRNVISDKHPSGVTFLHETKPSAVTTMPLGRKYGQFCGEPPLPRRESRKQHKLGRPGNTGLAFRAENPIYAKQ